MADANTSLRICDVCVKKANGDLGKLTNKSRAVQRLEITHSEPRTKMIVDLCGDHLRETPMFDLLHGFSTSNRVK